MSDTPGISCLSVKIETWRQVATIPLGALYLPHLHISSRSKWATYFMKPWSQKEAMKLMYLAYKPRRRLTLFGTSRVAVQRFQGNVNKAKLETAADTSWQTWWQHKLGKHIHLYCMQGLVGCDIIWYSLSIVHWWWPMRSSDLGCSHGITYENGFARRDVELPWWYGTELKIKN